MEERRVVDVDFSSGRYCAKIRSGRWGSRCVLKHFIALSNHSPPTHHSTEQPVGKMGDNVSNPVCLFYGYTETSRRAASGLIISWAFDRKGFFLVFIIILYVMNLRSGTANNNEHHHPLCPNASLRP